MHILFDTCFNINKLRKLITAFDSLKLYLCCRHSNSITSSYSPNDAYSFNVKLNALSLAGQIDSARKLFDQMSKRDVVSWNTMITAYWQFGCLQESKKLFETMPKRNVVSWNSMIAGCVENDNIADAYAYFSTMPERNIASWNVMISGFVKYDRIQEARRLFEEMPRRNVISYTAMIDGYMRQGDVDKARALFDSMPIKKNAVSWIVIISGYVENDRFNEAKELFQLMPDKKNAIAVTAMINGYCKEGNMDEARILFQGIQCKDSVAYNAMIVGYTQNGSAEEALKLHIEMLRMDLKPDQSTFVSVLTACSSLALLREGALNHAFIFKYGLDSHVSVCNALITMYSKCGAILYSELSFRDIKSPDLVSWNTIIVAFAQHGLYDNAVASFELMKLKYDPDGVTFLSLLSACNHAGLVNESLYWFESMVRNYKIFPRSEHYACLIDTLGRAGRLEKAYEIIQEMPFEADSAVWGALLAGCHAHSNLELAQLAASKLMTLDVRNSGAYIMLSNIYAAAGKWKEVRRVRGLMKGKGVKKQPAYSWMELGNKVHYFLGGDISHPYIQEIRSEINRINLHMKPREDISESLCLDLC